MTKKAKIFGSYLFSLYICSQIITINHLDQYGKTKRKRTREEVRAAVRETIRRKKEWIEKTNREFEMIRNGELKVEDLYRFS